MRRLLAVLFFAASLHAQQQPFHAALSGIDTECVIILPIGNPRLQWIVPDVDVSNTNVFTIASGDGVRVFALLHGSGVRIVQVEPDGTQTPFYQNLAYTASTLAVAPNGRVFVALSQAGSEFLGVISPAGVLEATYPLPILHLPLSMAVADDGCTVFYVDDLHTVRRINGCTGASLPNFATGISINDVDPLPNGQVLLAIDDRVALYDADGTFIRNVALLPSYGASDDQFVGQVAASNDLSTVWLTASQCGDTGTLLRVAFSNGAELARRDTMTNPNALVLGAGLAGVPTASGGMLLLLALGVCTVAIVILKGR